MYREERHLKTFFNRFIGTAVLVGILFLGTGNASLAFAEQEQPKKQVEPQNYTVTAATSEIKVDGNLDEKAWEDAVVINVPYEWLPGDNVPSPVDTDCLVTFDTNNFYIAFRCYDPEPAKIRAHLMDRDAIETFIQDDHINFMLDTFNDERRAFQFELERLAAQGRKSARAALEQDSKMETSLSGAGTSQKMTHENLLLAQKPAF